MSTDRRSLLRAAAAGSTAVIGGLAGCLSGDGGSGNEMGEETVQIRSDGAYGDILVDAEGMTLYLFTQDEEGESSCYDDCAENWPPLTVDGEPTAGDGVAAELGTTERDDGSTQVTAAGWPLYYFVQDEDPGDANGQGVNDVWWVVASDGSKGTESDDDDGPGY